jgi:hypothetical protein
MGNLPLASQSSIEKMHEEGGRRDSEPAETGDYNESVEEAKHPGAVLGLIMGIYPAVLILGVLLVLSIIGFRKNFERVSPDSQPIQKETAASSEALENAPQSQDAVSANRK